MDMERMAPWLLGGLVLLAVVLMTRRGGGGPAYVVADAGTGYAESVSGARAVMDYQLAREALSSEERVRMSEISSGLDLGRYQATITRDLGMGALDLQRSLGLESLSVERFLGQLSLTSQADAAREAASVRRYEIDAGLRRAETEAATQREAAARQQQSSGFLGFLNMVGSVIGSIVGLSGDEGYYQQLRQLAPDAGHADGQWGLMPVGGRS